MLDDTKTRLSSEIPLPYGNFGDMDGKGELDNGHKKAYIGT